MTWVAYPVKEQIRITDMYSFFEVHYGNGYAFLGEAHNFWECVYVIKGEACVSGNERVYNLSGGSIIFHKPMELHKFNIKGAEGADLLIFSFSAEGPLTSYLGEKVFCLSGFQKNIISNLLVFIHGRMPERASAASMYLGCLEPFHNIPIYSQMVAGYLEQLMLSLAESGAVSDASSAPDAAVFGKAISYLNSNINRQPSVPEIARFCSISEAGLKRIFDRYAGIGIHKYLLKLKIKAAVELLQEGESVSGVAERLGFNSQSYFSRAFKRETGLVPSAMRQAEAFSFTAEIAKRK